jgi:hypothetical protein
MTELNQTEHAKTLSKEEKIASRRVKAKERSKAWYSKNKEKHLRTIKEYNKKNEEDIRAWRKAYKEENKERIKAKNKEYNDRMKEKRAEKYRLKQETKRLEQEKYNEENREFLEQEKARIEKERAERKKARYRAYFHNNKKECVARNIKYHNERSKRDPLFAAKRKLRRAVHSAFYRIKRGKPTNTEKLLGCSYEEAKAHIESLWLEGMNWENHGPKGWHIDHIRPVCSFEEDELDQINLIDNLQPLWWKDNKEKGGTW